MIPTKPGDDIGDFLAFFTQMVGREAATQRIGASEANIARFAALVRFPLPALYLEYLREFGEDDPVLQVADDGCPELKYLFQCYEGEPRTEIPPNTVLIAAGGLSGQRALLYSSDSKLAEPTVVVSSQGAVENTIAQTFRNHLYGHAFSRGRWESGPSFILYQNDEHLVPAASETANRLGFCPYWFSDHWNEYLERPDGASLLITCDGDGMAVNGSCPNEKTRDDVRNHLKRLGLLESLGYAEASKKANKPAFPRSRN